MLNGSITRHDDIECVDQTNVMTIKRGESGGGNVAAARAISWHRGVFCEMRVVNRRTADRGHPDIMLYTKLCIFYYSFRTTIGKFAKKQQRLRLHYEGKRIVYTRLRLNLIYWIMNRAIERHRHQFFLFRKLYRYERVSYKFKYIQY